MKRFLLLCPLLLSGCLTHAGPEAPAPPGALACAAGEMDRMGYMVMGPPEGAGVRGEKEVYLGSRRSVARLTASVSRDAAGGARLRVQPERWEDRGYAGGADGPRGLPPGIGDVLERPRPGHPAAGRDSLAARRRTPGGYRRASAGFVAAEAREVLRACTGPREHPVAVAASR